MRQPLVVLDTNALVSRVWGSATMERIAAAIDEGAIIPVISTAILDEFREVIDTPKLRPRIDPKDVDIFINELQRFGKLVHPKKVLCCCKDPDDNMVFECAIEGNAHYIISGDAHLLSMNPFQGISILSPGDFVRTVLKC